MPNGFGDIGALLPSEGLFRRPGEAVQAARVQATKRAAFLSSMDQFFEQLNENVRQFDITTELKRQALEAEKGFREESLEFEREKLEEGLRFQRQQLGLEEELGVAGIDVRRQQLGLQEKAQFLQGQESQRRFELGEEELELQKQRQQQQFFLGTRELETRRELGIAEMGLKEQQFGARQEEEQFSRSLFERLMKIRFPEAVTEAVQPTQEPATASQRFSPLGESPIDAFLNL